jgi:hypothetical protein
MKGHMGGIVRYNLYLRQQHIVIYEFVDLTQPFKVLVVQYEFVDLTQPFKMLVVQHNQFKLNTN